MIHAPKITRMRVKPCSSQRTMILVSIGRTTEATILLAPYAEHRNARAYRHYYRRGSTNKRKEKIDPHRALLLTSRHQRQTPTDTSNVVENTPPCRQDNHHRVCSAPSPHNKHFIWPRQKNGNNRPPRSLQANAPLKRYSMPHVQNGN